MQQPGYIFGGQTGLTYDQIQKQRDIANELLRANMSTPQNVGEGLSAIGRALAAKAIDKRTSRADDANRKAYEASRDSTFAALGGFGGGSGGGANYAPSGTWTPAPPAPKPTDSFMGKPDAVFSGGNSFNMPATPAPQPSAPLSFGAAVMTPQEMLIEGAKARGLDPIDVATAISYETGGKFDPLIKGPTTQWGQHEGLIQFGDPQGAEHGAVFDQGADAAWRSQLNPTSGAVWSYLDSTGVQPGMGLDQIYSAINAGGVNRFGASDANNGGAPGTVADKVAGMAPHRENAAKFLGGTWTPSSDPAGQPAPTLVGGGVGGGMASPAVLMKLAEVIGNPYASESDKAIANLLMDQTVQSMDPMRAIERERAQIELDNLKNPQPGFRNMTDEEEAAAGLDTSGVYQQGQDGSINTIQAPVKPAEVSQLEKQYERAKSEGYQGDFVQYQLDLKKAGAPSTSVTVGGDAPAPSDEALRRKLMEGEGTAWSDHLKSGATASGMRQDMELLDQVIELAPSGPISGRLAEMFPGVSDAAGVFQSVVKRVAPSLRVEGSGSQSDIEYNGFLQSLPALQNRPEANRAIAAFLKGKAQVNMDRAAAVAAYQNGEIDAVTARKQIAEIDSRSIMSPEIESLLGALDQGDTGGTAGPAPDGVDQEVWDVMTDDERALFQ